MKQFTKEQAVALYDSKEWQNWTDEKIVKLQLFQKKLCIPFARFHKAMETVLGRPVYTHEFGWVDELKKEYLGAKKAPTLDEIIELIPEEKRIVIGL